MYRSGLEAEVHTEVDSVVIYAKTELVVVVLNSLVAEAADVRHEANLVRKCNLDTWTECNFECRCSVNTFWLVATV